MFLRRQRREPLGNEVLMAWYDRVEQLPAAIRQKDPPYPPFSPADDQTRAFHLGEQLGDVSFGNKEAVRQFLLRRTLGRADLSQDVELSQAQIPGAQLFGRRMVHLLEHPR